MCMRSILYNLICNTLIVFTIGRGIGNITSNFLDITLQQYYTRIYGRTSEICRKPVTFHQKTNILFQISIDVNWWCGTNYPPPTDQVSLLDSVCL